MIRFGLRTSCNNRFAGWQGSGISRRFLWRLPQPRPVNRAFHGTAKKFSSLRHTSARIPFPQWTRTSAQLRVCICMRAYMYMRSPCAKAGMQCVAGNALSRRYNARMFTCHVCAICLIVSRGDSDQERGPKRSYLQCRSAMSDTLPNWDICVS